MRRGLLTWNQDEVPADVLDARLARCRHALVEAGLPCLVVYTNFPRPSAVSWLTHFVPYWSQGVLVVLPDRAPVLIVSLSKRVGEWIATTTHAGEVVHTPDPGRVAGELIARACPGAGRIGVVDLGAFPIGIARPMLAALPGARPVDASDLFAEFRAPADASEIALSERAASIAATALGDGIAACDGDCGALISAAEGSARLAGAEEVLIRVAPDLARTARLDRIEGQAALGARYAVQVSVAYKGHWVRVARSIAGSGIAPDGWSEAAARFGEALTGLVPGKPAGPAIAAAAGGIAGASVAGWTLEGCVGTRPLSLLDGIDHPGSAPAEPRTGSVRVLSLRLDLADGPWLAAAPVAIGATANAAARPLLS